MSELSKGDQAPEFDAEDGTGKRWKLSELRGQRVILYFYPADDTPGCTAEACDFRDSKAVFDDAGYVVLGVSPQGAASHQSFSDKYELNFPLLIDMDLSMAKDYGSVREEPEVWNDIPLHVSRSTFVIDENGVIEQALYKVKARGHVDALKESITS